MKNTKRNYKLTFIERVLGTCPPKDTYEKYILSKGEDLTDEQSQDELDMTTGSVAGEETGGKIPVTRFHRNPGGLWLVDYQVKGMIKNAGNTLKDQLGIKALRSKVSDFVFVFPRWIFLKAEPDGIFSRPLRAQTMQGPRVSMVASEFVEIGTQIDITIDLIEHKEISWETIHQLLDYGAYQGIGQFRNGSFGRFTWEEVTTQ